MDWDECDEVTLNISTLIELDLIFDKNLKIGNGRSTLYTICIKTNTINKISKITHLLY